MYCAASTPCAASSFAQAAAFGTGSSSSVASRLSSGLNAAQVERRRAAGAALVDEHDVAVLAHAGQRRGEGAEEARRLAGAAGEDEQRVGARIERVGGQHRDRKRDLAAVGLVAVLRDLERAALRGDGSFGSRQSASAIAARGGNASPQPARARTDEGRRRRGGTRSATERHESGAVIAADA